MTPFGDDVNASAARRNRHPVRYAIGGSGRYRIPALFARLRNDRDPHALASLFDEDAEFSYASPVCVGTTASPYERRAHTTGAHLQINAWRATRRRSSHSHEASPWVTREWRFPARLCLLKSPLSCCGR